MNTNTPETLSSVTRTLLTDAVVADAMRTVYADRYACYCEETAIDRRFSGVEITTAIDYREGLDAELLPIGWDWIAKIEKAWGRTVDEVFTAMGLVEENDLGRFLWHLFAPCIGHGVSLLDDDADEFEEACRILGINHPNADAPVDLYDDAVDDLARNDLDAEINAGKVGLRSDSGEVYKVGDTIDEDGVESTITRFHPGDRDCENGYFDLTYADSTVKKLAFTEFA